jgi:hypothetical protein
MNPFSMTRRKRLALPEHFSKPARITGMVKRVVLGISGAIVLAAAFGAGLLARPPRPQNQQPGKFPEQIL